ncbi:MAG: enoyl-CoA hydratase [Henriciella sp.]|jgi:2-(1,2-epoxy-1,2-dihydrophenyl)acetyl-CoA isomerase|uniref:crotonase/enoyl-CoA hydratase family protein n=1 Tax=Henriciella sp. TaxID=1968823 RepID=UPI000C11FFE6|nr:crotonase/enoyl-CoA hydratase family protein [Henriciella sp.]MAN73551.1 enoyl-CoA hydratase [Henriciella sp.]MBF34720.1 enoyl-CoA hydratase [Hyphomonadaceae bacterium]PHR74756.1 MAG: enoyl-CoA hydratase [Henriciella sp.]|tara:strand:- start:35118 stop:35915 length:798 start_codon:yes stop_codon:yes gene_type:complete
MSVIKLEKSGSIATLTLTRPDMMNALGQEGDGPAVTAACAEIEADPDIRVAILTGEGRAFSAGGDVKAMRDKTGAFGGSPNQIRNGYRRNIHMVVKSLYNLEVPLISAVNGAAIGLGCDVACMADVRIASDKAKFGVTFLKLGLIPGDGGAWLLPRIIGSARAAQLLFTGDVIDAETALDWGLISEVHAPEALMDSAMALAERMAVQPPQALRLAKTLLRHGQTASYDTIMELSAASQALMHETEDHMEGVHAILEKRAPKFEGK